MSAAWDPSFEGSSPALVNFEAIWDTGATHSVVTQKVIDACGLVATGIVQVHGVTGAAESETLLVNIALPHGVVITGVRVTKGDFRGGDVLIGMDIITMGDFAVTNHNGTTVFSFRMPSQEHIDFVPKTNQAQQTPPNRAARRRAKRDTK